MHVDPVISVFLHVWSNDLPENERDTLLRPVLQRAKGAYSTVEAQQQRIALVADWLIREHTPTWLRLADLVDMANTFENLPRIADYVQIQPLKPWLENMKRKVVSVHKATSTEDINTHDTAVVRAAAFGATCCAAWGLSRYTGNPRDSDALWWVDMMSLCYYAAAIANTKQDLRPTVIALQTSALRLLDRMIAVTHEGDTTDAR